MINRNPILFIAAIIAAGFFVYTYIVFIKVVAACAADQACTAVDPKDLNTTGIYILNVTWGLIIAVILAKLAITSHVRGENPLKDNDAKRLGLKPSILMVIMFYLYFIIWLAAGVVAFIYALKKPDMSETLSDIFTTWFGTLIGAAYAYWGIEPPSTDGKAVTE